MRPRQAREHPKELAPMLVGVPCCEGHGHDMSKLARPERIDELVVAVHEDDELAPAARPIGLDRAEQSEGALAEIAIAHRTFGRGSVDVGQAVCARLPGDQW